MVEKRKVTIDGEEFEVEIEQKNGDWAATVEGHTFTVKMDSEKVAKPKKRRRGDGPRKMSGVVSSNIPGKVVTLEVEVGQQVEQGEVILVLEAMKMQNEVAAPITGTVSEINCAAGANVEANVPLVVIQPDTSDD